MNKVLEADKYIFSLINYRWHNSFFDSVLPFMRESSLWIPLYLFLLVFALTNVQKWWWFILLAGCTPALTDILSSHIIKENIIRIRPCRDPDMAGMVRVLASYCPQSSSFTSSHAANHFGLATFLSLTLRPFIRSWVYLFYFWAFLIVYAQIYVGVHYPIDILGGAAVGVIIGSLTAWLYNKKLAPFTLEHN
jgi:membrane-associated phospholipid phosphatase